MKRLLLYLAIFLAAGELALRFDAATLFFQGSQAEHLGNKPVSSELLTALEEGLFAAEPGQLRVLLLGDSVLFRRSLPEDQAFSCVLEDRLRESSLGAGREVLLLDLFTPGIGTVQQRDLYFEFVDDFRPDIVFWAYNRSDVLQVNAAVLAGLPVAGAAPTTDLRMGWRQNMELAVISCKNWFMAECRVGAYLNENFTLLLKSWGVILPGSRFDFMLKRSHHPDYKPWLRTQELFREVQHRCAEDGTYMLVMVTPLLDILPYYHLVEGMDGELEAAFRSLNADCINGVAPFLDDPRSDFAVSRYDNHPNGPAQAIMGEAVARHIIEHCEVRRANAPPG